MKIRYSALLSLIVLSLFWVSCSDSAKDYKDACLLNPCAESLIPNKTTCEQIGDDFTCVCNPGYKLKDDLCVKISNNTPCENNPCTKENKTICTVIGETYECNCDVGAHLEGDTCIKDVGTPCENYECSDELSSCQIDIDGAPYCACYGGYVNTSDGCKFDCSNILGSIVNEENDACICEENYHIENDKCISNTKRVSCKSENPDQPLYSNEVIEPVDVLWNEVEENWEEPAYCLWSCFEEYTGENCELCNDDYVMNENNTCIYDCSNDENSVPNESNNACVCTDSYHVGMDGFCVETVNPCSPNPCLDNDGNSGLTNCFANSQEMGDYTCLCEDGFEENTDGICIELSEVHLRAVAGNITSGNYQSYDYGHGIRIFQGLKADVMMVQEFNYKDNTDNDYKEMVEAVFQDEGCLSSTPQRCFYEVGTGAVIPNGVMSKYPIISWGEWADPASGVDSTRHLNYAIVDIPGNKDLFVVSVHLHTSPSSDQIASAVVIVNAIKEIKQEANYLGYYFMVGGDFNGSAAVSDDGFGMYDTFNINDENPLGEDGSPGTSANRSKILDWLLVSNDLSLKQVPSKFCAENNSNDCKSYSNGLVMDTRDFSQTQLDTYFSPSFFDNQVLDVDDSGAGSMQHMAVVKDFLINFGN
jgi:endonuclease/exonuclease/phosphatase family metal-dependent hydrolase